MSNTELKTIETIRNAYVPYEPTKLDELKELNRKVKRPAKIFAYTFGAAGSLVLGTGMCLAMKVIGNLMPLGIVVGALGIVAVSANYFLYKKLLRARKRKYGKEIIKLSDELLNQ